LIDLLKRNPYAFVLALLFHLALMLLFRVSPEVRFMDSAAPIESQLEDESPEPEDDPETEVNEALPEDALTVVVEESLLAEKLQQLQKSEKMLNVLGLRMPEDPRIVAMRKKEKEEQRRRELEEQRKKEELEKKKAEEKRRQELEKKKAEEKKQQELEKKKAAEKKAADKKAAEKKAADKKAADKKAADKKAADKKAADKKTKASANGAKSNSGKNGESGNARKKGADSGKGKSGGTGGGGSGRHSGGGGGDNYNKYISQIRSKITRNWRRPPEIDNGLTTSLRVKLFPGGAVADVSVTRSSGNPVYDRSALDAVKKASPLPVPKGSGFDKFRSFKLKFSPTGIR